MSYSLRRGRSDQFKNAQNYMDNVNLQQTITIVVDYTTCPSVNISDWLADMRSEDFFLDPSEGLYSPQCTSSA